MKPEATLLCESYCRNDEWRMTGTFSFTRRRRTQLFCFLAGPDYPEFKKKARSLHLLK